MLRDGAGGGASILGYFGAWLVNLAPTPQRTQKQGLIKGLLLVSLKAD